MRILFISNFYPPYAIGGYEQWCQEVADSLIDRGHDVHVLTSRYGINPNEHESEGNITRRLHLQADLNYYNVKDFFLKNPRQERENGNELRKVIDQVDPDVIMIWGMWNLSLNVAYWAEKWLPGQVAYFISSYWPLDEDLHRVYWQMPTQRAISALVKQPLRILAEHRLRNYPPELRFEHAVCCSEYVRDTLLTAGKVPPTTGVLLGGTEPKHFLKHSRLAQKSSKLAEGEADSKLHLLYFGRLIHDKGVHTAITALGLLQQRGMGEHIELTILGCGHPDYEAKLFALVNKFGLSQQINFIGQIPRDEVPKKLGEHDVYLFTSIWPEPMARTVMEAMAAGLLVIGTEVGGQREMLRNGENSLTFPAEDAEQLAAHIAAVVDNPTQRTDLAAAGQQMVLEKFTLTRMTTDIERFLHTVVEKSTTCKQSATKQASMIEALPAHEGTIHRPSLV